jgi:hypothetical protein
MTYNNNANYSKASFQADIKRKQAMFNRFKKRYCATTNPTERRWLKNEAMRVATELHTCSKRWQTWGYGANTWITRNFTMTRFNYGATTRQARRTTTRSNVTNRTYNTRTTGNYWNQPTTNRRPRTQRTTRARTTCGRGTYAAW